MSYVTMALAAVLDGRCDLLDVRLAASRRVQRWVPRQLGNVEWLMIELDSGSPLWYQVGGRPISNHIQVAPNQRWAERAAEHDPHGPERSYEQWDPSLVRPEDIERMREFGLC